MAPQTPPAQQSVNPKLNTNYAIFTSLVVSVFLLLIIFEQLGIPQGMLGTISIFLTALIISMIGLISFTNRSSDFYTSGRRVPAFYNGMAIAATSLGASGFAGFLGCIFFMGYDALALGIGVVAGLLLMAIFFSPYLRKMGAYTLPSFFAQRYDSNIMRVITLVVISLPVTILLVAELNLAIYSLSLLFQDAQMPIVLAILAVIFSCTLGGGMRSLTWTQCAKFLIIVIGLLVPIIIVAIQVTNIPFPQLTYGTILDNITSLEQTSGISKHTATTVRDTLPSVDPSFLKIPTLQSFGALTPLQFVFLFITIMLGSACLPAVLIRMSTTPSVNEARKSSAWALALVSLIIISLPAYALFTKLMLFENLQEFSPDQLPSWLTQLQQNGFLAFGSTGKSYLDMTSLGLSRDILLPVLPYASGFPFILVALTICAVFFAATSAASAQILMLSNMISHDVAYSLFAPRLSEAAQTHISRFCILMITLLICMIALSMSIDSLKLMLYALAMIASSLFPALFLAIWWRSCKKSGLILGMLSGLGVSIFIILLSEQGINFLSVEGYTSAIIGAPVCFVVSIIMSLTSSEPIDIKNNVLDDTRIPGGETIYDRVIRNKVRKQQKAIALDA